MTWSEVRRRGQNPQDPTQSFIQLHKMIDFVLSAKQFWLEIILPKHLKLESVHLSPNKFWIKWQFRNKIFEDSKFKIFNCTYSKSPSVKTFLLLNGFRKFYTTKFFFQNKTQRRKCLFARVLYTNEIHPLTYKYSCFY